VISAIREPEKVCATCRVPKPLSAFDREGSVKDGRRASCKVCRRPVNRSYQKRRRRRLKVRDIYHLPDPNLKEKECSCCRRIRSVKHFWLNAKKCGDGYQSQCKDCQRQAHKDPKKDPALRPVILLLFATAFAKWGRITLAAGRAAELEKSGII
jgi:hypothetical protein